MSLGNTNNNNNKLSILKIKTRDAEKHDIPPYFSVSEKNAEGKWTEVSQVKDLAADLVRVEVGEREFEGEPYNEIKLTFEDKNLQESYLLDLRMNLLSRNIFNSLFSLSSFENIELGLYQKRGEKTYPAVSVKQSGQRVDWKYKLDEQPKMNKVLVGKKTVVDSTELDEFYVEKLKELAARVKGGTKSEPTVGTLQKKAPVTKAVKSATPKVDLEVTESAESESFDDVPF